MGETLSPVKRSNGEFLPLAVRTVSGYSKDEQLAFEDKTVFFLLSSSPWIGQSSRAHLIKTSKSQTSDGKISAVPISCRVNVLVV